MPVRTFEIGSGWRADIIKRSDGLQVTLYNELRVSPIQLSPTMTARLLWALEEFK